MEENALIANIATILTKDMLFDNSKNLRQPPPAQLPSSSLLDSDDEAFAFFLEQQQQKQQQQDEEQQQQQQHHQQDDQLGSPTECKSSQPVRIGANARSSQPRTTRKDEGRPGERKKIPPKKRRTRTAQRPEELNLLNKFKPAEFESYMHLSKMSFLKIFQFIRDVLQNASSLVSMPQTIFSLSIWKLTTDEHYEEMERKFQIPAEQTSVMIRQFWTNLSSKYQRFVRWPHSATAQQNTIRGFRQHKRLNSFANLFGVMALKRWDIFLESRDEEVPVILQIICDSNEKIIDCCVELAEDYLFDNTPIAKALALNSIQTTIPANSYFIGDKCFPLRSYLMRPFENVCDDRRQLFNELLRPSIALAEEVLNTMAMRFNSLYALEAKDLDEVRHIVETVCTLHNLCVEVEDNYVERNRDMVKFNWANTGAWELHIHGGECNKDGIQRRDNLMYVMHNEVHNASGQLGRV